MADAWADFNSQLALFNQGKITSGDVFGTRAYLKNNYSYRMAAAVLGIYGNSKQEAMYPLYGVDSYRPETHPEPTTKCLHFANPTIATCERLLVVDHVQNAGEPSCCESDQPLPHQLADAARTHQGCRWRSDPRCPERISRQRQGSQLATRTEGSVHDVSAALLAQRGSVGRANGLRRNLTVSNEPPLSLESTSETLTSK